MNKNFLPYYNSLNEKEKTFWLECSKEELIDHFIANIKNGEVLLQRIDKAIEWVHKHISKYNCKGITIIDWNELSNPNDLLEILGGNNETI